jgi:hypothetical protein
MTTTLGYEVNDRLATMSPVQSRLQPLPRRGKGVVAAAAEL